MTKSRSTSDGGHFCPLCPIERRPKGEGTWTTGGAYICWNCLKELQALLDERREAAASKVSQ